MASDKPSFRLSSLDVFRGITIAGMILVNQTGVVGDDKVYAPLLHANWNGCTPTDLVFPFFLFIVGVAIAFAFAKYNTENRPTASIYWRILRRSLILFILGLFLNGFWNKGVGTFDLSSIRIMGVLQRIGLVYFFASIAVLNLSKKALWVLTGVLLVGSWMAMTIIPVPGYGAGVLTREGNFGAFFDRLIIPAAHLYKADGYNFMGDPEGLFGTIVAIATVLLGYFTGEWLRRYSVNSNRSMDLVLFGLSNIVLGIIWDAVFPLNKKLWTSSYVLFTAGWAILILAACYELIEVRKIRRWGKPFEVLGLNAIAIFVASVLAIKILVRIKIGTGENASSLFTWIYQNLFAAWIGAKNGSLLFALVTVLIWLAVAYVMYRKKWLIKV